MSPDRVARGRAIAERRVALGIKTVSEFSRRTGMSRNTISSAEAGTASSNTYLELEAWLNNESGRVRQADGGGEEVEVVGQIEFDIIGPISERETGFRFTVSGPVEDADELRRQVIDLARELGAIPGTQKEAPERN